MNKGDQVTCRERVEAYYSNYGITPECWFEPGDVGVVVKTGVPSVWTGGAPTFVVVDFHKNGRLWRVGIGNNNLRRI